MKTTTNRKQCQIGRAVVILVALALGAVIAGCPGSPPAYSAEIRTWHDLDAVRYHLDKSFTLMNDLDADTAGYDQLAGPTANRGKGWQPLGAAADPRRSGMFTGTFDAQGYEIRDLFIDRPDEMQVGLFYVNGAVIENVGLVNVTVTGGRSVGALVGRNYGSVSNSYSTGSVTGMDWSVGGLVGDNGDTVVNCHFSGSVSGGNGVGGLVGDNWGGTVSSSHAIAGVTGDQSVGGLVGLNRGTVVTSYSAGSVTGDQDVGGLVGTNGGTVRDSYSVSSATGEWWVGGLAGHNHSTVENSYSAGSVTGDLAVGGLVGDSTGVVNNSFWDVGTSGMQESDGGIGKTTAEMMNMVTFTDTATEGLDEPWDIAVVAANVPDPAYTWNIVDGDTYPFLVWQSVD